MAILTSEMQLMLSTTAGAAGYAATSTPSASLGKYVSTTAVTAGANTLFDDITGAENAASTVDYRLIFVHNANATLTATNVTVYLSAEVAGGASIAIALDNIAASARNSAPAQAAQVATETTAPSGTGAFSSPTTDGTGLAIGSLGPQQVKGVWVRRTAANTVAVADGVTIAVSFDTPA